MSVGPPAQGPETSAALRATVALATGLAVWAAWWPGTIPAAAAAAVVAIVAGGSASSWRWALRGRVTGLAGAPANAAVAVLVGLTIALAGRALGDRPRAALLVPVLVAIAAQSFDLRRRRDLTLSLALSTTLVAIAATDARTPGFAMPLTLWAIAVAAGLVLAHRRSLAGPGPSAPSREVGGALRPLAGLITLTCVVGGALFLVAPVPRLSLAFLSSALPSALQVPTPGGLSNPTAGPEGATTRFGYFGFTDRLDTSVRGRPDGTVVMRVQTPSPTFWRGQTFDTWDGRSWTQSDQRAFRLPPADPVRLGSLPGVPVPNGPDVTVERFDILQPGPNVIFQPPGATEVYLPQATLYELTDGTIRTGQEIGPGTSYTVVSRRPRVSAAALRAAGWSPRDAPPEVLGPDTQLPALTPRVRALATRLAGAAPTAYDAILAMERWIGAHTRYSLDAPVPPAGADAVDRFLFVDRLGFCEQIATSLVVMLRAAGVPARLAVGYVPGDRDPLTGEYDIRASDAHAWAEAYFPGIGWQAFDPTASVPLAPANPRAASGLRRELAGAARSAVAWIFAGVGALVVALAFSARPLRRALARRREARDRTWAAAAGARLEAVGARHGRRRRPHETLPEYAAALAGALPPVGRTDRLAALVETADWSGRALGPAERAAVEADLAELEARRPARRRWRRGRARAN